MKKFIVKVFFFLILIFISIYIVFLQADGSTDAFYLRFTEPKQNSLVIGTSRAAQGVIPSILNHELNRSDIFNFSFTIAHSPYGPVYLKSIKKKLNNNSKDGIFILAIDPWSISANKKHPNDPTRFIENNKFLKTINLVNSKPNIEYLLTNYNQSYINLFKTNNKMFLHKDGWLEVTPKMTDRVNKLRIRERIGFYRDSLLPNYGFSKIRYKYVLETISFLKQYGEVYLIRLPIHPEMMKIESQLMPDFNVKIKEAVNISTDYYDMTFLNKELNYTDGNHLYKDSGKIVSKLIADRIKWKRNID